MLYYLINASLAGVSFKHEIYPQAALQGVYFLFAVWGICKWSGYKNPLKKKNKQR